MHCNGQRIAFDPPAFDEHALDCTPAAPARVRAKARIVFANTPLRASAATIERP
jgi:hypothetical protein